MRNRVIHHRNGNPRKNNIDNLQITETTTEDVRNRLFKKVSDEDKNIMMTKDTQINQDNIIREDSGKCDS